MIVPSSRLLFFSALLGVPLSTAAAIFPASREACALLLGLLAIAAAADAYAGRLAWLRISVSAATPLKLVRGRTGSLKLRVHNGSAGSLTMRVVPAFPSSLQPEEKVLFIDALTSQGEALREIRICATERGNSRLDGCFIEAASPLKLWLARGRAALTVAIQVQPNLAANKVAAVFLRHSQSGLKAYRQLGQGREFEKLREYSPGDTFDQIYWKATARRAYPVTKVFQVERAQQCYVLLDCSRQSAAGHTLDYFVEAALVMGLAAQHFGDQFGVLAFSDRVHAFEPARPGRVQFGRCRNAIYALEPQPVSADFTELAIFTQLHVRKRSLLFLLTNLADPYAAESLAAQVRLLAARHVVVVGALQPAGVNRMFDGPRPETVSDIYSALAGHLSWKKMREFGTAIQTQGAELALCSAATIYADLTNRYQQIRQRQRL
jgi:uncharacterized protein (DUF58 family)